MIEDLIELSQPLVLDECSFEPRLEACLIADFALSQQWGSIAIA